MYTIFAKFAQRSFFMRQHLYRYLMVTLGCVLMGIAINAFYMPNKLISGGIGDVQKWNMNGGFNLWGNDVHGVRAKHHQLGARNFQLVCRMAQHLPRLFPAPFMLQQFNVVEIHAQHDTAR